MIALIQRVTQAHVVVNQAVRPAIGRGLVVLLCAEKGDTLSHADRLLAKLLAYRVFGDEQGKMNLSVRDITGQLLIVSQFTLAADTRSGTRPSFGPAASPEIAKCLYEHFVLHAHQSGLKVETGEFGADMQITLTNDGPVTFWLQISPT